MALEVNERYLSIEKMELGPYGTNTYIIVFKNTGESLVVDAPAEPESIVKGLIGTKPVYILLTHDHFDHTMVLDELRARLNVPLVAHLEDSRSLLKSPEIFVNDGDTISLGNIKIEVLHTPGHTPGSLCFKIRKYLIAGDTIFPGGPGNTRTPNDFRKIIGSITGKILILPGDTRIFPGHGADTTVEEARQEYADFLSRSHPADLCGDVLWATS